MEITPSPPCGKYVLADIIWRKNMNKGQKKWGRRKKKEKRGQATGNGKLMRKIKGVKIKAKRVR
jgi:hypothetical protein